ncbi:hypothetical protein J2W30_000670 [Variovorax boronicumulans]|uniref:hypothetical protein n=1 Tax=Variovorax TaxID=34072 RepID=UPI002780676E|nr:MULTISPECIES: hypothetical protein [Variovorax]MDQ0032929.1 hypothetical protein [Variovorax boronicumulans]MDQ0609228.1 hypothetical protein [Variovorax sp. W1I1]
MKSHLRSHSDEPRYFPDTAKTRSDFSGSDFHSLGRTIVHHAPFQTVLEYLAVSVIVRDIGLAHLIPHIPRANSTPVWRIELDAAMGNQQDLYRLNFRGLVVAGGNMQHGISADITAFAFPFRSFLKK